MDRMAELATIVNEPYAYLQSIKNQSGKKIVGTVCSYAPEELIHAAGALPVRLFGSDAAGSHADLHLQSYCCSLVRGILGDALAGRLNLLDGMVFPHTCDTIQRLSDVWRINLPQTFHSDVVLPVKLDTPSARQYLMDVLSKFVQELGVKLGHPVSDADLAKLGQHVEDTLRASGLAEVPSDQVGLAILAPLRALDPVAYLRFASVYRQYDSVDDFEREIADLRSTPVTV